MDVILLENIRNVGKLGNKVRVANGFGRNYLIPKGKAISATSANLAKFEAQRSDLERAAQDRMRQAQERAEKIDTITLTIAGRAGEEGKLFGSIGTIEIVRAYGEQGVELHRDEIRLPKGPLRELGEHSIEIHLHAEVIAHAHITITPDKEK